MSWLAHNKLYLTGSITSSLVLSSSNADGGTIPTDMSIATYDDYTYDDTTYEITALYEGTYQSSFTVSQITWIPVGSANIIKYQVNESDDNITYDGWSTLSDAVTNNSFVVNKEYFKIRFIFYSNLWDDTDSVYISTIARYFTVFQTGDLIDANEVNENFYVIAQDHMIPRGSALLSPTTAAYNIGSAAFKWSNIHVNEMILDGDLESSINLVSNILLSASSNRIEFSGLGTNNQYLYYMRCRFVIDSITSDISTLHFNGDSATNYGYHLMYNTTGSRLGTTTGIYIGQGDSGTSVMGSFTGWLNFHESFPRTVVGYGSKGIATATAEYTFNVGGIWSGTNTVTSIVLYNPSKFAIGTEVQLWVKK